jgi:hypothetical protein
VRSTVWVGMKMLRAANFGHPRQWRERWTRALWHRQFEEEAERLCLPKTLSGMTRGRAYE